MEKTNHHKFCALIPCAGMGKRSGLSYPKSLFIINKKPILIHILILLSQYTNNIFVVINKKDEKLFNKVLKKYNFEINFVYQNKPNGMGDAILKAEKKIKNYEDILLVWGDIPFIQKKTVDILFNKYFKSNYDFLFVSRMVKNPYTIVKRDNKNKIISVKETKHIKKSISHGERDIGLFIFKKEITFELLKNKYDIKNKEHGFLYIIEHLVKKNFKIDALTIAKAIETKSLNSVIDLT